ncbi:hypothetical protein Dip510_000659 [Elusimicrobium posterum]|uniref:hypothetical protein n=1 Tax=Elusimicrobium posterum TaxID=3116653 RepID=UPI003C7353E1
MKESYKNMRDFWLEPANLMPKNEKLPFLGEKRICIAGIEFAMADHEGVLKNIFIAGSSLGDASMYFENNSASGIGGFIGGLGNPRVKEASIAMLKIAGDMAHKMTEVKELPKIDKAGEFIFFAIAVDHIYINKVAEADINKTEHEFFKFFAETQNILIGFREAEAAEMAAKKAAPAEKEDKK